MLKKPEIVESLGSKRKKSNAQLERGHAFLHLSAPDPAPSSRSRELDIGPLGCISSTKIRIVRGQSVRPERDA